MATSTGTANVIGAGPNGLAAAITLAQAGLKVTVYEAESVPGGGARTMELTAPGFRNDFGSAVHPMGVGSPFFRSLPLGEYGLTWIYPPAECAHPLEDGSAVLQVRDLEEQCRRLGVDGAAWRRIFGPISRHWWEAVEDALQPMSPWPKHPLLLAQIGAWGAWPASLLADWLFDDPRTRALFAGLAAHSFLPLNRPFSAAFALLLGAAGHAVGWPIPQGGSQAITDAMIRYLTTLGGEVRTSSPVETLDDLEPATVTCCDVSPQQLVNMAGDRLHSVDRQRFLSFRRGPGIFKVDYALREPIPWRAKDCALSATVHIGGTFEEIAASEHAMSAGRTAERPFVLLTQPSLFDSTRAPAGQHTAWAYCHVPNGCREDMLPRIEAQIERFAPGFSDCVLARGIFYPADLHAMDRNLAGGDIAGGAADGTQFLLRPGWRFYATGDPTLYLCSASTPPGGGVHGMCGYNAARMALRRLGFKQQSA